LRAGQSSIAAMTASGLDQIEHQDTSPRHQRPSIRQPTDAERTRLWRKFRDAGGACVADISGVLGVIMIGMCF
jgi:hypothetical protein